MKYIYFTKYLIYINKRKIKFTILSTISLINRFSTFSFNNSILNKSSFFNSREINKSSNRLKALLVKLTFNYLFKEE